MRHCVATRARDVLAGHCYIYRVFLPNERGTLQVGIQATATWWTSSDSQTTRNLHWRPGTRSNSGWKGWAARSRAKKFPVPAID
jgi:hypothetical protein